MAHLIIPTSNSFWKKGPLLGDDDKGLRIFFNNFNNFLFLGTNEDSKIFEIQGNA
jgi:hypothetical protein